MDILESEMLGHNTKDLINYKFVKGNICFKWVGDVWS
jgi:hypothetical protein